MLLKEVDEPQRFGVAMVRDGRLTEIVEKPRRPASRLAVTGCYAYNSDMSDIIRSLKPSARSELETTDADCAYLKRGVLEYNVLGGWWQDAGSSFEAYARSQILARELRLQHAE